MSATSVGAPGIRAEISNESVPSVKDVKRSFLNVSKVAKVRFLESLLEVRGDKKRVSVHLEANSVFSREQVTLTVLVVLIICMIFGSLARLICNLVGFAYPAYASAKALRNARKNGDTRWLMYWTVFAVFSFIDNFAEIITKHFPIYWLLKAFFFFCLYFPDGRGSWMLYKRYVNPAIAMIDDCIDAYQNRRNTTAEQKRQISSNE